MSDSGGSSTIPSTDWNEGVSAFCAAPDYFTKSSLSETVHVSFLGSYTWKHTNLERMIAFCPSYCANKMIDTWSGDGKKIIIDDGDTIGLWHTTAASQPKCATGSYRIYRLKLLPCILEDGSGNMEIAWVVHEEGGTTPNGDVATGGLLC